MKKRPRKKNNFKISAKTQLVLAVILLAIYTVFISNLFRIQKINILESNKYQKDSLLNSLTLDVKKQNIILFKKNNLENRIKNHFPQIKNLELKKQLPQTLVIKYDKFEKLAYLEQTELETSYFTINETGLIEKTDIKPIELPKIILEGIRLEEGMQIITPEKLNFIVDSINHLKKELEVNTTEIKYLPKAQETHLITDNGTKIWLDMTYDYKQQLNKLKFAKPHINLQNKYQYIDLRIKSAKGHKIFYKE